MRFACEERKRLNHSHLRVPLLAIAMASVLAFGPSSLASAGSPEAATKTIHNDTLAGTGRFFTNLGQNGTGFGVRNYVDGPRLLDAFERFGGVEVMGFPSSRPWIGEGGFVYQLTQRALLQWSPADRLVRLANLYEILEIDGFDEELLAHHIPPPETDDSKSLTEATSIRLGWLTDPGIAAAFAHNPIDPENIAASLELHGLPMSHPIRIGPFVVQRFQRTALQHWVEAVDGGQPVGTVVLVNSGDLFKDFLFPGSLVAEPHTYSDTRVADIRASALVALEFGNANSRTYNVIDDAVAEALRLLEGVEINESALDLAADLDIRFRTTQRYPRQILATFTSPDLIVVNHLLSAEDAGVMATVIAHELVHLEDFHGGLLDGSRASCLLGEKRAIEREARTWAALVGPDGKQPPTTNLERIENARLQAFQEGGAALVRLVGLIYADFC